LIVKVLADTRIKINSYTKRLIKGQAENSCDVTHLINSPETYTFAEPFLNHAEIPSYTFSNHLDPFESGRILFPRWNVFSATPLPKPQARREH
jgi:hypothetical protein